MCGIVGAVAREDVVPFLVQGLCQLEYRGYDSAGIGILNNDIRVLKSFGRVHKLKEKISKASFRGLIGIAHTRWATHGRPSEKNAHPHVSGNKIAIVHNGIIEDHELLRRQLLLDGQQFFSETDSEIIAHLIIQEVGRKRVSVLEATQRCLPKLKGSYALAIINREKPDELIIARRGSPILIGLAKNAIYCASDVSAIIEKTAKVVHLEDGDVATLSCDGYRIYDTNGKTVSRQVSTSRIAHNDVSLGRHKHFMQKEVYEQPQAINDTLSMALAGESINPNLFGSTAGEIFSNINSITILGCGTSYHAGLTARYWIEDLAGIPCNVEISSEYRYRNRPPEQDNLVIVASQSGETADTIAALQQALSLQGNCSLAICNVPESSLVRLSHLKFLTRAGPEIGVASTKAFTTQLVSFFLLAITLAKAKGKLTQNQENSHLSLLKKLPSLVKTALGLEKAIKGWADIFSTKNNCIFLGRGIHYPIALEGALKLKEISYVHAEGYPAGELKHGPLALIDNNFPVVVVAPNDLLLEKLKSNMKEVSARGGELYVFADSNSAIKEEPGLSIIAMPDDSSHISPIVHTIPLQLLAYHTALLKGTDIDKPRNLAKSVTVE